MTTCASDAPRPHSGSISTHRARLGKVETSRLNLADLHGNDASSGDEAKTQRVTRSGGRQATGIIFTTLEVFRRPPVPGISLIGAGGHRFSLTPRFTVGRASDTCLLIMDDRISRRHAMLEWRGGAEVVLKDLGSTNGTFLNGELVNESRPLTARDIVRFACYEFRLSFALPGAG